jgi:hypothetical protein
MGPVQRRYGHSLDKVVAVELMQNAKVVFLVITVFVWHHDPLLAKGDLVGLMQNVRLDFLVLVGFAAHSSTFL